MYYLICKRWKEKERGRGKKEEILPIFPRVTLSVTKYHHIFQTEDYSSTPKSSSAPQNILPFLSALGKAMLLTV